MLTSALFLLAASMASATPLMSDAVTGYVCPKNATIAKGTTCGAAGAVASPSVQGNYYSRPNTLNECIDDCQAMGSDYCSSFSFNTQGSVCTFYNEGLKAMGFKKSKTTTKFYDASCYACTKCTATLLNGGFDSGSINPWFAADDITAGSIVKPGYAKSAYAYQFSIPPGGGPSDGDLRQTVHWCSGTTYKFTYAYNVSAGTTNNMCITVNAGSFPSASGGPVTQNCDLTADNTWHTASFTYAPDSDNGAFNFNFLNFDSSVTMTLEFDGVTITN